MSKAIALVAHDQCKDAQIASMIAEKKPDALIFFIDALSALPLDA